MKRIRRIMAAVILFLAGLYLVAGPASAHRVNLFAWIEGDTVFLESKFAGGRKVKAGKIVVMDPAGHELLEGVTDDQGEFSFKIPERTDLRIILIAGQGHQAEWTIPATEIEQMPAAALNESNAGKPASSKTADAAPSSAPATESMVAAPAMDLQQLEILIEKILDQKLKPITKMLVEARDRSPSVSDILGGIGYILGLIGIAAYFHSRRQKN